MNLTFNITQTGNVYHLLNAVSNWHPRCRPNLQEWYRVMFGLSRTDTEILAGYARVRQQDSSFPQQESLIPAAFLLGQDEATALQTLADALPEASFQSIRACFEHFYENASLLYRRCLPDLMRRREELAERSQVIKFEALIQTLCGFFGARPELPDLQVHLLLNTCSGCTGGYALVGYPGHVTVEPKYLGKSHPEYVSSDFSVIAHEASHLVVASNPQLAPLIQAALAEAGLEAKMADYIEEALIGTQFPFGHLAVRSGLFSSAKVLDWQARPLPDPQEQPNLYIYTLQNKLAAGIYPLAREYLERGRPVSEGDLLSLTAQHLADLVKQPA